MALTAEQISRNWEKLLTIIEKKITGERKDKLLQLYKKLEERMILAPASSKEHFHNAFPGGYVDHIIRVAHCSLKVKSLWEEMGAVIDFTDEELIFSALNHDLGKIGSLEEECYIEETSDWHKKNQGSMYKVNSKLDFMLIPDRSLFLLQESGIQISQKEYLAIKLHDGTYEDSNKPYYISFNPDSRLRTNLVHVLHQADFLASKIEYDHWKSSKKDTVQVNRETKPALSAGKNVKLGEGVKAIEF
jgi:hypothetical protein